MKVLLIFFGIFVGIFVPIQTAVNSRLRISVNSVNLASFFSFFSGTIILTIITLISGQPLAFTSHQIAILPWWAYIGGLLAFACLTLNIVFFKTLGSVLTVILPISGQMVMSLLIDNFGWFDSQQLSLTLSKICGAIILFIGLYMAVVYGNKSKATAIKSSNHFNKFLLEILAVGEGAIFACEAAINAHLGVTIHSSAHSALLAFFIATVILAFVCLIHGDFKALSRLSLYPVPWWGYLGGLFGSLNVYSQAFLIPLLGNGVATLLALLGQMIMSLLIDQFALFQSAQRKINRPKILGLCIMLIGIMIIELL